MIALRTFLGRLSRASDGAMAIETAVVAPILLVLSLGGVEAGSMVARQSELQSAAAEALNIVQAAPPINPAQRTAIRDILKVSTGITSNDNVTVTEIYRCGTDADFVAAEADCGTAAIATYIEIVLVDSYEPSWVAFGIGHEIDYNVVRTVQVS